MFIQYYIIRKKILKKLNNKKHKLGGKKILKKLNNKKHKLGGKKILKKLNNKSYFVSNFSGTYTPTDVLN
jgi:hypothetical protein